MFREIEDELVVPPVRLQHSWQFCVADGASVSGDDCLGAELGDVGELQRRVETDPQDHQARFDLALALNARNKREEAAGELLEIIRQDRTWKEDGARKQLLQFFEAWGFTDPSSASGRRKLSCMLFRSCLPRGQHEH